MKLRKTRSIARRSIRPRRCMRLGWPSRPSSRSFKQNEKFTLSSRGKPRERERRTCKAVLITVRMDLCVCCHASCAERSCGDGEQRQTRRELFCAEHRYGGMAYYYFVGEVALYDQGAAVGAIVVICGIVW